MVRLNFENANKLIGEEIPSEIIKRILRSLDININSVTETGLGLTVPAYRNDVTREADIIEEILRVYGYDNIETTEKLNASISNSAGIEDYQLQNIVGSQLTSLGFFEILNNSLTTPDYSKLSENSSQDLEVKIINPLSNDLSIMRQSLLFSGLEVISYNLNHKNDRLKLFEFGKTYFHIEGSQVEHKRMSLFICGDKNSERWTGPQQQSTFFYLKGIVNSILQRIGIDGTKSLPLANKDFSEGLNISLGSQVLVEFGVLSKEILDYFGIEQEILYADFKWDTILKLIQNKKLVFKPISKYPKVRRDFALLVDENISFEMLREIANNTEKKFLKEIDLFDVYQGKNLPSGKKSYAMSFILQDESKTLTDQQIEKIMAKLQSNFETQAGAVLR